MALTVRCHTTGSQRLNGLARRKKLWRVASTANGAIRSRAAGSGDIRRSRGVAGVYVLGGLRLTGEPGLADEPGECVAARLMRLSLTMSSMSVQTLLTLVDYAALPDDGRLHELVEGELGELSFPRLKHTRLQQRISFELSKYLEANPVGEVGQAGGFVLSRDPDTLRGPDVYFLSADRSRQADPDLWVEGAPELAVEIVSPSNTASELRRKIRHYFGAGCWLLWVVYPDEREVHVFEGGETVRILGPADRLEAPALLPGFSLELGDFFA